MTAAELAHLVRDMRRAQRDYFATRNPGLLARARQLELAVDAACDEILSPGLFATIEEPRS